MVEAKFAQLRIHFIKENLVQLMACNLWDNSI